METEVVCGDPFGAEAYGKLFDEIMVDINKATLMEKAKLVLKPEIPLFIFSVKLKAEPSSKTIGDVSTVRSESDNAHLTITDERYAPEILNVLWKAYGRESVHQQTRFDMDVVGASEKDVKAMVVASGEESLKEIIGAVWRSMPEGIKNRHTFVDGTVITVVATEERFQQSMLDEGMDVHRDMGGRAHV